MLKQQATEIAGEAIGAKSALGLRDGEADLLHFVEGKGYRTILEIGTFKGLSAALLAQHCEKVITIDLAAGQLETAGVRFDRHEFWASLGISNIDLYLVADNAEKERLIASLEFDFAFVDGAHDETVADDFRMVRKCGNVLFHDYSDRPGKPNHVKRFVDSIGVSEVRDIFALWRG